MVQCQGYSSMWERQHSLTGTLARVSDKGLVSVLRSPRCSCRGGRGDVLGLCLFVGVKEAERGGAPVPGGGVQKLCLPFSKLLSGPAGAPGPGGTSTTTQRLQASTSSARVHESRTLCGQSSPG